MKASMTTLAIVLTIGSLGLAAASASACGGYKGGYKSYGYKSNYKKVYVKKVYVQPRYVEPIYDQCHHPCYSTCFVMPGDTWFTLSKRIYGTPTMWKHIASYNGLGMGASLPIGQQLRLPVVNANGTLAASSAAPAPMNFGAQGQAGFPGQGFAPQGQPFGAQSQPMAPQFGQQFGQPGMPQTNAPQLNATPNAQPNQQQAAPAQSATATANIRTVSTEASLPSVAIGSTLMLDGQELGDERGSVRLRVSGLALPIGIIEWNNNSAKIQLPQLDLTSSIKAEIEVLRADGSLASKSAVNLTPAATRLALGN